MTCQSAGPATNTWFALPTSTTTGLVQISQLSRGQQVLDTHDRRCSARASNVPACSTVQSVTWCSGHSPSSIVVCLTDRATVVSTLKTVHGTTAVLYLEHHLRGFKISTRIRTQMGQGKEIPPLIASWCSVRGQLGGFHETQLLSSGTTFQRSTTRRTILYTMK